jgi:hypothetical protein
MICRLASLAPAGFTSLIHGSEALLAVGTAVLSRNKINTPRSRPPSHPRFSKASPPLSLYPITLLHSGLGPQAILREDPREYGVLHRHVIPRNPVTGRVELEARCPTLPGLKEGWHTHLSGTEEFASPEGPGLSHEHLRGEYNAAGDLFAHQ